MRLTSGLLAMWIVLLLAACGESQSARDYRNPDELARAVKAQLEDEGKPVDKVVCIEGVGGRFACAYKLDTGLSAVRRVSVAPDGKTWSEM